MSQPVRVTIIRGEAAPGPPIVVERPDGGGPARVDGEPVDATLVAGRGPVRRLDVRSSSGEVVSHGVLVLDGERAGAGTSNDRRTPAGIVRREVVLDGWRFEVEVEMEARAGLRERATRGGTSSAATAALEVRAIIAGRVLSTDVTAGDHVEAGQRVMTIEAMKMQNELRAPRDGTVSRVAVAPGETIEVGDLLLVIE
jgi:biotin carboxyl carrier protein